MVFDLYFEELKQRYPTAEATRRFIEVLKLGESYTEEQIADALDEALKRRCLDTADVGELLRRMTEVPVRRTTTLVDYPHLAAIRVNEPDLRCFDRLLDWTKGGGA